MNEKVLFKLDDFCKANKIEYTVTGTVALSLLGVMPNYTPHDIDIKVHHVKEEQLAKLKELHMLSGIENENYDNEKFFSFVIYGVHINVFVDDTKSYDEILSNEVTLDIIDKSKAVHHNIGVQLVHLALKDKMALKRHKDKDFMLSLINKLTSL